MLTDFEYRYLKRNKRRFKMTRDEAAEAFQVANVPQFPVFIDFQSTYAGYSPDDDVVFGIVGPTDQDDGEPRSTKLDQLWLARCDLSNRMQIRLRVDENGLFYFEDRPVAESFESYLRFKAYCDVTLQSLGWTFIDHERRETKKFKQFYARLGSAFVVDSATDRFHSVRKCEQYFETEIGGNRSLFVRPDALKARG